MTETENRPAYEAAAETDLLTYLREREPEELVPLGGNVYCTRTHDSLKISNGKWMWWSRGFGGYTAMGYLMRVRGMSYREAAAAVAGCVRQPSIAAEASERELRLPEKAPGCRRVTAYLESRGIDPALIAQCAETGLLYESLPHRSAVFVGRDGAGIPRYAAFRSTGKERVLGEVGGSDKRYSFRLTGGTDGTVHVFESAIDALSYETVCRMSGDPPGRRDLLSLGGVTAGDRVPPALSGFLKDHPDTRLVILHLDNDRAGREASAAIRRSLENRIPVRDAPPPLGKDVNDWLMELRKKEKKKGKERDDDRK